MGLISRVVTGCLTFFFVLNLGSFAWAKTECSSVFPYPIVPKTSSYFIERVDGLNSHARHPEWVDIRVEKARSASWQGTQEAPALIRKTLTKEMALIDFQLIGADPGTVKSSNPGNFVQARLRHSWNGYDMSTNVGLPIHTVFSRLIDGKVDSNTGLSTETQLIRSQDAKAIILFFHGGGTKTTGHHVAAALSNYMAQYGIAVVALDGPAHAFGPPVLFRDPTQEAKYLVHFRNTFLPKDVPVIISGHSRGGVIVDMLMRMSDRPELGLREAFAGGISLSTPIDAAPGGTLAEKAAAEKKFDADPRMRTEVPAEEVDLNIQLLKQGKIASVSGVASGLYMGFVDWVMPEHGGREYFPTHYQMGAFDGLYIGREAIFDRYVKGLENTDVLIMDKRPGFKGGIKKVAHMIFDHYRPDSKIQESFQSQLEFIENRVLSQKLEANSKVPGGDRYGLLIKVVQEYYTNLAFKVFAREFSIVHQKASAEVAEQGAQIKALTTESKRLDRIKSRTPEQEQEFKEVQAKLTSLQMRQQLREVPEGELGEFAKKNIAERDQLAEGIAKQQEVKKGLLRQLQGNRKQGEIGLADQKAELEKKLTKTVERLLDELLESQGEAAVPKEITQLGKVIDELVALMEKQNEASEKVMAEQRGTPGAEMELPESLLEINHQFAAKMKEFIGAQEQARSAIHHLATKGELDQYLAGGNVREIYHQLYGEGGSINEPVVGSLANRVAELEKLVVNVDISMTEQTNKLNDLVQKYVERVAPGLYTFSRVTVETELSKDLEALLSDSKSLQKLWSIWTEIWKERPQVEVNSLY